MEKALVELCKLYRKQFKLLYLGCRDGYGASCFHTKCENQASTLTIIQTPFGLLFGGYTSVAWDSSFTYKTDPNAFIFSLINPSKLYSY